MHTLPQSKFVQMALIPSIADNGLIFTYTVRGEIVTASRDRMVLIQCPGWGIGPRYLASGLTALESEYNLVFFHPRGSAGSSRPANPSAMTSFNMAADLKFFRQYLNIDRFPAMHGLSHGGTIVLAYAELFPQRVAKLVLVDRWLLSHDDSAAVIRYQEERKGDLRFEAAYRALHTRLPTNDEELKKFMTTIIPIYFFDPQTHVPPYLVGIGDQSYSFWCLESCGNAIGRFRLLKDD
ncbi:hypothetical protein ACJ72_00722 [Emergomyces africanus]|uniref:AB hydrolase-1 domain-containing protein n=1 Tax=Emergomyces africanus TaxID=1955775 RepID=A0A1B7P786_9EURO|nr:hypothetical protein ACJ72_00722 [Emergomyces africanus]